MKFSQRGQSMTEVMMSASILGIIALLSVNAYTDYNKGAAKQREALLQASFSSSFSQLAADPYLVKEMFLDSGANPTLQSCLTKGTSCPTQWGPLEFDRTLDWAYSNQRVSFDFRTVSDEIVEIRMKRTGTSSQLIWISRYDYLNLNAQLRKLECRPPQVVGGIDYSNLSPICVIPTPHWAPKEKDAT